MIMSYNYVSHYIIQYITTYINLSGSITNTYVDVFPYCIFQYMQVLANDMLAPYTISFKWKHTT